jgi:hypothetical protein
MLRKRADWICSSRLSRHGLRDDYLRREEVDHRRHVAAKERKRSDDGRRDEGASDCVFHGREAPLIADELIEVADHMVTELLLLKNGEALFRAGLMSSSSICCVGQNRYVHSMPMH